MGILIADLPDGRISFLNGHGHEILRQIDASLAEESTLQAWEARSRERDRSELAQMFQSQHFPPQQLFRYELSFTHEKEESISLLRLNASGISFDSDHPDSILVCFENINLDRDRVADLITDLSQAEGRYDGKVEELRKVALELSRAEESERKRLSEFLHDEVQQYLVAASLNLGRIQGMTDHHEIREICAHTEDALDHGRELIRTMSATLSPTVVYEAGLWPALDWLMDWFEDTHGLKVESHLETPLEPVNEHVSAVLFESIRELLFNVVKHSGELTATIEARQDADGWLHITVIDDGRGFNSKTLDEERPSTPGTLGLPRLRYRLQALGGEFYVRSIPGDGVKAELRLPLDCGL